MFLKSIRAVEDLFRSVSDVLEELLLCRRRIWYVCCQASAVPCLFFSLHAWKQHFLFFFLSLFPPHFGDPEIQVWFARFCWRVSLFVSFFFSKFEGLDIFCSGTELSRLASEPSVYCSAVRSIGVISNTQIISCCRYNTIDSFLPLFSGNYGWYFHFSSMFLLSSIIP